VGYANADRIFGYQSGLTNNPNDMALMLNLILPFAIALFLASRKGSRRLLLAGVIGLIVAAIVFTFSRAGFIALAVTFFCYMWMLRRRRERIFAPLALVLALAAVPFLPDSYFERIGTITDIEEDETGSAQTRWADMGAGTRFLLTHPITGAGIGQNVLAMNEARGSTWLEIHNVYLMIGIELGFPGLILFLMLIASCLRATRETRDLARRARMDTLFLITEGARVSLIAFTVEAMFHPVAYHFYFYIIAGLALALPKVYEMEAQSGTAREKS
jgi:putative inorganic carbon (hco3(-)) transporter